MDPVRSALAALDSPEEGFEITVYQPGSDAPGGRGVGVRFWLAKDPDHLPCWSFLLEPGYDHPEAHQCHSFEVAALAVPEQPCDVLMVTGTDGRMISLTFGTDGRDAEDIARWQQYVAANREHIAQADGGLRQALQDMQRAHEEARR